MNVFARRSRRRSDREWGLGRDRKGTDYEGVPGGIMGHGNVVGGPTKERGRYTDGFKRRVLGVEDRTVRVRPLTRYRRSRRVFGKGGVRDGRGIRVRDGRDRCVEGLKGVCTSRKVQRHAKVKGDVPCEKG